MTGKRTAGHHHPQSCSLCDNVSHVFLVWCREGSGGRRSPANIIVQAFQHIAGGARRRKRSKPSKTKGGVVPAATAAEASPVVLMNGCNGHVNHTITSPTSSSTTTASAEDGDDEQERGEPDAQDDEEEDDYDPHVSAQAGAWNRWAEACELSRLGHSDLGTSDYGGYSSTSPKGMTRSKQGAFLSFGPGRGVMSGRGWNHLRERALTTQATSWEAAVNSYTRPSMYQLRYHLKVSHSAKRDRGVVERDNKRRSIAQYRSRDS